MKGGALAAMVVAAEALAAARTPLRIVLALVADEEDASQGSEAVMANYRASGRTSASSASPPTSCSPGRCAGSPSSGVRFQVGRPRRSQPALGVNAVSRVARFVTAVDARSAAVRAAGGDLMVHVARGGASPFVSRGGRVPRGATVPGEDATSAMDGVRELLESGTDATAELDAYRERLYDTRPAADLGHPLGRALGPGRPSTRPTGWRRRSGPTLVCGPLGGGLHAADEWVYFARCALARRCRTC